MLGFAFEVELVVDDGVWVLSIILKIKMRLDKALGEFGSLLRTYVEIIDKSYVSRLRKNWTR